VDPELAELALGEATGAINVDDGEELVDLLLGQLAVGGADGMLELVMAHGAAEVVVEVAEDLRALLEESGEIRVDSRRDAEGSATVVAALIGIARLALVRLWHHERAWLTTSKTALHHARLTHRSALDNRHGTLALHDALTLHNTLALHDALTLHDGHGALALHDTLALHNTLALHDGYGGLTLHDALALDNTLTLHDRSA